MDVNVEFGETGMRILALDTTMSSWFIWSFGHLFFIDVVHLKLDADKAEKHYFEKKLYLYRYQHAQVVIYLIATVLLLYRVLWHMKKFGVHYLCTRKQKKKKLAGQDKAEQGVKGGGAPQQGEGEGEEKAVFQFLENRLDGIWGDPITGEQHTL